MERTWCGYFPNHTRTLCIRLCCPERLGGVSSSAVLIRLARLALCVQPVRLAMRSGLGSRSIGSFRLWRDAPARLKSSNVKYGIFSAIKSLALDEDWGDPTKYDLNIKVDKNAPPTGYYTVIPQTKKPLTAVEQKLQDEMDLDALTKRCQPPAEEGAMRYFQKLTGGVVETTLAEVKAEADRASGNKVEAAKVLPVSLADSLADSIFDVEFPDYQTSK